MDNNPRLFGIKNTNRDLSDMKNWGKNQFNSSFPVSLLCYMKSKNIQPVYLTLAESSTNSKVVPKYIDVNQLFNIAEGKNCEDIYFEFEGMYLPHNKIDEEALRSDVVIKSLEGEYLNHFEVKLTALPDTTTAHRSEDEYGSELVIRTVTIIHLAINLIEIYKGNLEELKEDIQITYEVKDWLNAEEMIEKIPQFYSALENIMQKKNAFQKPLVLQPVWKTDGQKAVLKNDALDTFVWSDFALLRLCLDSINLNSKKITRFSRSMIWILFLLQRYTFDKKINSKLAYQITYGIQTDKGFACDGRKTHRYMQSPELRSPRITKKEISNIILGNGQLMLKPERRFDATIYYSLDIFE